MHKHTQTHIHTQLDESIKCCSHVYVLGMTTWVSVILLVAQLWKSLDLSVSWHELPPVLHHIGEPHEIHTIHVMMWNDVVIMQVLFRQPYSWSFLIAAFLSYRGDTILSQLTSFLSIFIKRFHEKLVLILT